MHMRAVVGLVLLVTGLSACGGNSETVGPGSIALVDEVDAICTEWRRALDARGEFPVDDFDPEQPRAADLPVVADYFASATTAQENALLALRELSPPEEDQAKLNNLITAVDGQLASASKQIEAARNSDVSGFTATLDNASATIEELKSATEALGVPGCGS